MRNFYLEARAGSAVFFVFCLLLLSGCGSNFIVDSWYEASQTSSPPEEPPEEPAPPEEPPEEPAPPDAPPDSTTPPAVKLGSPYINLPGGVFVDDDTEIYSFDQLTRSGIELVSTLTSASIYYTITCSTGGAIPPEPPEPTAKSAMYSSPISIDSLDSEAGGPVTAVKIKAIASEKWFTDSDVMVSKTIEVVRRWYKYYDYKIHVDIKDTVVFDVMTPLAIVSDEGTFYGIEVINDRGATYMWPQLKVPLATGEEASYCSVPICAFSEGEGLTLCFPQASEGEKIQYRKWREAKDMSGRALTYWPTSAAQIGIAPRITINGEQTPMFKTIVNYGRSSTSYGTAEFYWFPEVFVETR